VRHRSENRAASVTGASSGLGSAVALALFLLSDQAAFITGVTVPIDGGRHLTCAR